MEKLNKSKRSRWAIGIAAGSFLLTGCVNYAGEGNEFIVRGPVTDVTDKSVQILPVDIVYVEGRAVDWFEQDHPSRSHDNYHNEWCNEEEVGSVVLDEQGHEQGLEDIGEGEWVEIHGKLRESKEVCGKYPSWSYRPVFDVVQELSR